MQMSNIQATIEAALQHHQNGSLGQAREQYEIVLQADPGNPAALYSLGLIAFETHEYEQAVVLIGRAIEQNPQIPQFYNALGVVFKAQEKPQKAIEAYKQALNQILQLYMKKCRLNCLNAALVLTGYTIALIIGTTTVNVGSQNQACCSRHSKILIWI